MKRRQIDADMVITIFQNTNIVAFASAKDLACLRRASRLFWSLLYQVETVRFEMGNFHVNYAWTKSLTCLRKLYLMNVNVGDFDLYTLRHLHLTDLYLCPSCKTEVFNDGLRALVTSSPDMTTFCMKGGVLKDAIGAEIFRVMPRLTCLNLQCRGVDGPLMRALPGETIESLDLDVWCDSIEDHVLKNTALGQFVSKSHYSLVVLSLSIHAEYDGRPFTWGRYASLETLNVNGMVRITNSTLEVLASHTPNMKEFMYDDPEFTNVTPFAKWRNLDTLHLRDIEMTDTDEIMGLESVLRACLKIRVVDICGNVVYGKGIPILVARCCPNLETAIMTWSVTTECLILLLARCKKLTRLYVELTTLSRIDFTILNEMKLTDMHLSYFPNELTPTEDTPAQIFEAFAGILRNRLSVDESVCDYFELSAADLKTYGVKVCEYL